MPIIKCRSAILMQKLGRKFTESTFSDLCFDFGIELDAVTSEKQMYLDMAGDNVDKQHLSTLSDEEIWKIELPANRYDLLCVEGLCTALKVFLGQREPPKFRHTSEPKLSLTVDPSVLPVRPYVVCAILRGMKFDDESYKSFIDLQEKLHGNLGRKRSLVSIGTHDLDTVTPPFTFAGVPKEDIDFLPLAHADRGNLRGGSIDEYYKNDKHIGQYVPLINSFPNFPVVKDAKDTIMSLPPIINSDHSKISIDTKNIFIECTAVDYTKAVIFLNMVVTAFSEYCSEEFSVEPVTVHYPKDHKLPWLQSDTIVTPNFSEREFNVECDYITKSIGVDVTDQEMCVLLKKMLHTASPAPDGKSIDVKVPCTRADILHKADIMEDVAIAYGYDKLLKQSQPPATLSFGKQQPREAMRQLLRTELGLAGFTEMMTFSLCSELEATSFCRREENFYAGGSGLVRIGNPCTKEFQVCRPSLLPGTLKTIAHSKDQPLPISVFEVTDVVIKDKSHRIGARNETHLCAARCASDTAGFELIHGTFEYVMSRLGIEAKSSANPDGWYYEAGSDDKCFYDGWQVNLFCQGKQIGTMGVVHPWVLKSFDIPFPCSYLEFNVEPFVRTN